MLASSKNSKRNENISSSPLQVFEIYLKHDSFFPGEVMSGKILALADRKLITQGIYLKFEGKAGAKWEKRQAHLWCLQEAEYAEGKCTIFTNVFRYDENTIPEGSSALPFEFELPSGVPPTIFPNSVMKQLRISYSIEALIRTPYMDYRKTKYFSVKGLLNLNRFPELSLPICKTSREIIFDSCWSSLGKPVAFSFSIAKQGFVPGEKLVGNLFVKDVTRCGTDDEKNTILSMLSHVEMSLIQEVHVSFGDNRRVQKRSLSKNDVVHMSALKNFDAVANRRRPFERKVCFGLKIPEDALITYENFGKEQNFLKVKHFLRVTMEQASFPYRLIKIQLPIKIGTVWIQEQKAIPILLLASVPFTLSCHTGLQDRFHAANGGNEVGNKEDEACFLQTIPLSAAVALLPELLLKSSVMVDVDATELEKEEEAKNCSK